MPERIQLRRTKGWRKPEGVIVVARPTWWGNPYSIGWCVRAECRRPAKHWHVRMRGEETPLLTRETKAEAAAIAVERYRNAVERGWGFVPWPTEIRQHLAGRDLACWCPLDSPCHADVLLEIANA